MQVSTSESGRHIVAGAGELHLEICLENDHAQSQSRLMIQLSPNWIINNFLSESTNENNHIYMKAFPIQEELSNDGKNYSMWWFQNMCTHPCWRIWMEYY